MSSEVFLSIFPGVCYCWSLVA